MYIEQLSGSSTSDQLICNVPDVPTDASNLVIKAFNLFRNRTGIKATFKCDLQKTVPHGAGLGGGSGNAATALWAANELTGRPASVEDLLTWSGDIGSDISVFFSQGAAYCTGRGEVVEEVQPPLPLSTPILLVKPPVGLSTPEIFKALDLGRRSTADPKALLEGLIQSREVSPLLTVNDLEQPAFDRLPALKELKDRLAAVTNNNNNNSNSNKKEGELAYDSVFMTGSGSTIVCIGSDEVPEFLAEEPQYRDLFISPARFITRKPGEWYEKSTEYSSGSGQVKAAISAES
jgi:4-diphosphocytidyl-2-C-methyl-D-erythritol kinase